MLTKESLLFENLGLTHAACHRGPRSPTGNVQCPFTAAMLPAFIKGKGYFPLVSFSVQINLKLAQDGMLQWKYGVYALDIKSNIDFWILQNFSSCFIHEEEASTLSLGTLYLIYKEDACLTVSHWDFSRYSLFTVLLNLEYWKHTNVLWERRNTFPIFSHVSSSLPHFI